MAIRLPRHRVGVVLQQEDAGDMTVREWAQKNATLVAGAAGLAIGLPEVKPPTLNELASRSCQVMAALRNMPPPQDCESSSLDERISLAVQKGVDDALRKVPPVSVSSSPSPVQATRQAAAMPELKPSKKPGELWTEADYLELLRQFNELRKSGFSAKKAQLDLADAWGFGSESIRQFLTRARALKVSPSTRLVRCA